MNWIYLVLAGMLEICWAIGLKSSNGFTRLYPAIFTIIAMAASVFLLAIAMRTLPLGTAYAVWTGIGALGTVVVGMVYFGESASILRLLCLSMIFCGIVGLKILAK